MIRELAQLPALDGQLQHTAAIVPGVSVTIYAPIAPARTAAWQSLRRGLVPLAGDLVSGVPTALNALMAAGSLGLAATFCSAADALLRALMTASSVSLSWPM